MGHREKRDAPTGGAKLNSAPGVRTDQPLRASCNHSDAPAHAALNTSADAAQESVTTSLFMRTERPVSPLQTWRLRGALALQECFDELQAEGHEIYTKRGLAGRCGLDEKIVRKWCRAEKAIPAASLPLWWPALAKRWLQKMGLA